MYLEWVAGFLGVSVLLYCVMAGADFGAGILEAMRGRRWRQEQRHVISHAISPVWEANHIWLIMAVVILFVAFPRAYSVLSVALHIPLTVMLLGIVFRGCAFTFRQYDAVQDRSQTVYSLLFRVSSFVTPLTLGAIAGAMFLGRIHPAGAPDFYRAFIWPWANLFCLSVGLFTGVLFTFLAAVYLIGETNDSELRRKFVGRALIFNTLAIVTGALVLLFGELEGLPLVERFASDLPAAGCMLLATFVLVPLWIALLQPAPYVARVLAGAQVGFVLLGWFRLQWPNIINGPEPITLYNSAAPEATLRFLLLALAVGSLLIFPALFYLLKIFKAESAAEG